MDGEKVSTPISCAVTDILNSSLGEGKLPDLWKTATVVTVPKKHHPGSLENGIRPIVFESIVLNWFDDVTIPQIDEHHTPCRLQQSF